jgi:hypothetical protein
MSQVFSEPRIKPACWEQMIGFFKDKAFRKYIGGYIKIMRIKKLVVHTGLGSRYISTEIIIRILASEIFNTIIK